MSKRRTHRHEQGEQPGVACRRPREPGRPMRSEKPANHANPTDHTPNAGGADDAAPRGEAASQSVPADEDHSTGQADQTKRTELPTSPIENERLLEAVCERAVTGIACLSLQGRWLHFNQRLCELLGYSREELAACAWQDLAHPDDRGTSSAHFRRLLVGELDAYDIDARYVRKDGAAIWVNLAVSLVRSPAGAPDFAIVMVQDIIERKRLELDRAHLLEQERAARAAAEATLARAMGCEVESAERAQRLHTILETMADGVGVYDQVGRIVQCNRAYRELLAADRIPGFDAIPLADRAPLLDMRDAATGEPLHLEDFSVTHALRGEVVARPFADIRLRALDGREVDVNVSAAPLRDGNRRVVGAVSVIHDVTSRRRLAREREEARAHELAEHELNRRKDEFMSLLSHELRTPLTSLQGYTQLLARSFDAWRPREQAEEGATHRAGDVGLARTLLAYAEVSLQRLTRLADDLIDDTRIREGRLTFRPVACELGAIVGAAVEEQRALEPHRTIHLEMPTAQPVLLAADAERIAQVVTNYLTNALKYSKEDRPVTVRLQVEREVTGDVARVSVRDEGPGLSLSDQAHLFERFPPIEGATVQSGSGVSLGLGLYISKAIIEAHGGRVGVESAVGEGSTFWLTLPLAHEPTTETSLAPA
jgi:PAS domain S-box-containing protein